MPKITYLLGAGASAQALPTIKGYTIDEEEFPGLTTELIEFARYLTLNEFDQKIAKGGFSVGDLAEKCLSFNTPDLFAKYLLETSDMVNYRRLKVLLSLYISNRERGFIQTDHDFPAFDRRAMQFLITLMDRKKLPRNVKVVSWNYDGQLELASDFMSLGERFASWPNVPSGSYDGDYFLLHLNGIAGYVTNKKLVFEYVDQDRSLDISEEPLLSFAWENQEDAKLDYFFANRFKHLHEMIKETDILVVVGYSFPFFNRNIDKRVIDSMRKSLTKIYYQDPDVNRNGDFLYDQFNLDPGTVLIKHITDINQYYIPYEL